MLTIDEILDDFAVYCGVEFNDRSVNMRSSRGESPLHWMATLGDHLAVSLLLKNGANVTVVDINGETPLHFAVRNRHNLTASVLLQNGACVFQKNMVGLSAADLAIADANMPIIALFKT